MIIYTSYFGGMAMLRSAGFKPGQLVSIARSPPLQFTGMKDVRSYKLLAPSWSLLNDWHRGMKPSEYVARFEKEQLEGLNPTQIAPELLQKEKEVVLLCYEPPGQFCHRHIVADWFKKAGYQTEEWSV